MDPPARSLSCRGLAAAARRLAQLRPSLSPLPSCCVWCAASEYSRVPSSAAAGATTSSGAALALPQRLETHTRPPPVDRLPACPTAAERSAKQPTALEPLARLSSRATAGRARAARGDPESPGSISNIPLEITKIAILSRGERSGGGGGAARAPHAPPNPRRRNDRRQTAPITSSPGPTCRSRPPEITEIASSSRDEGAVGGGGIVRAPKGVSRRLIMTLDLLAQKSRSSQRFWCNAASLATSLTHPPAPTRP